MPHPDVPAAGRTVFFLSDYGTRDEFVGVIHAVLVAAAPGVTVIDLTHRIPAFDVRAGAHTLCRAVPSLGPGVVLAVVDPGVGTARRGLCLHCANPAGGPSLFVGPDNGLLLAAAELCSAGHPIEAVELAPSPTPGSSFDGRDLFAPAVAALCRGAAPADLGQPVPASTLVRLFEAVVAFGRLPDGRPCLRAEVTWVDRFGNVQLAATARRAGEEGLVLRPGVTVTVLGDAPGGPPLPAALVPDGTTLRCVDSFADLNPGELGLLVDANGHVAVVAREASAARWLNISAGELLVLAW